MWPPGWAAASTATPLRKTRLFHEYVVAPSTNILSRPPPFSTNILSRRHEYVVAHPTANSLSQRHFHGALYSLYYLPSESRSRPPACGKEPHHGLAIPPAPIPSSAIRSSIAAVSPATSRTEGNWSVIRPNPPAKGNPDFLAELLAARCGSTSALAALSRPLALFWPELAIQFGCQTARPTFRRLFLRATAAVLAVYIEAWVRAGMDALTLFPSPPHVDRTPDPGHGRSSALPAAPPRVGVALRKCCARRRLWRSGVFHECLVARARTDLPRFRGQFRRPRHLRLHCRCRGTRRGGRPPSTSIRSAGERHEPTGISMKTTVTSSAMLNA